MGLGLVLAMARLSPEDIQAIASATKDLMTDDFDSHKKAFKDEISQLENRLEAKTLGKS